MGDVPGRLSEGNVIPATPACRLPPHHLPAGACPARAAPLRFRSVVTSRFGQPILAETGNRSSDPKSAVMLLVDMESYGVRWFGGPS
jgi:hypothetical protein